MMRRIIVISALLVGGLLAGCNMTGLPVAPTATPPQPTPTTEAAQPTGTARAAQPTSTARAAQATRTGTPSVTAEDVEKLLLEIEEDTADMRGLQPKSDVKETFITRDQYREHLIEELEEEYSREEAAQDTLEMWLLRLVDDPKLDMYQLYVDLHTEGVAGYYDPEKDELFILSEGLELDPQARETLAHEFVHSLQDQYYDLEKLLPDETEDSDRSLAHRSLIEGDATFSGYSYAFQHMSEEDYQSLFEPDEESSSEVYDRSPLYIRESLIFPYTHGFSFVEQLMEAGHFRAVNDAFEDPPASSEQIMHPEKYLEEPRDEPFPVTLVPLTGTLGTGWTMAETDTLGEFDLWAILEDNGAARANAAAAGWGGSKYSLYRNGDQAVLMLDTFWDTRKDADEFEKALRETFESAEEENGMWVDRGRYFAMHFDKDRVLLISGTERSAVERALAEASK